jgi:ribosomal protein L11 methylase PrmA
LANLTLPVFLKYQNHIKNISTETLVISGIGTEQIADIEQIFKDAFSIKSTLEKDEWALVELRKK